jgi:hypothetical protein
MPVFLELLAMADHLVGGWRTRLTTFVKVTTPRSTSSEQEKHYTGDHSYLATFLYIYTNLNHFLK